MKAKKITLLSMTSLGLLFGSVAPLTSCSKTNTDTVSLTFTCSEGISLSGDTQIKVNKGTTWGDLLNNNKIPTPVVPETYTSIDWCRYVDDDNWQRMSLEDVINDDTTIKFFAFDNTKHEPTVVTFNFSPDKEAEPAILDFATNFTLRQFRMYYSVPSTPTTEGYKFDGFYKVTSSNEETKIDDTYVIGFYDTIKIKWTIETYTAALSTDGNGGVSQDHVDFNYNSTFYSIIKDVKLTPNDGFKFDKWVDENDNEIDLNTKMTNSFLAKAVFAPAAKYQITFSCSDGVTLSPKDPITVTEGMIWGDVKNLPSVTIDPDYIDIGWVAVSDDGTFQALTPEFVISRGLNAKYFAYKAAPEQCLRVHYYSNPTDKSAYVAFLALPNITFKMFREYYKIPATPTYEGYTFVRFEDENGNEVTDTTLLQGVPEETTLVIKAKFEHIKFTIPLITDSHGSTSVEILNDVPYGTRWADAVKDVVIYPNKWYKFNTWVNNDTGQTINDDYKVTSAFTAIACFTERDLAFFLIENRARDYVDEKHYHSDIKWKDTRKGYDGDKKTWKEPSLINDTVRYESAYKSLYGRLITSTIRLDIKVAPYKIKTTKINIGGNVHATLPDPYWLEDGYDFSCQIFDLKNENDHPDFYTHYCHTACDTRCIKQYRIKRQCGSHTHAVSFDEPIENTQIKYVDHNETAEYRTFTHYFSVSFYVSFQWLNHHTQSTFIADFKITDQ